MKKKAIEKIPYKRIAEIPKGYTYCAVAFVKIIDKEKNLIVDIYNRQKKAVMRNCYTQKDFAGYIIDEDIWTQMQTYDMYGRTRWEELTNHTGKTYISSEDKQKVEKFLKSDRPYYKDNWLGQLRSHEQDIKIKRETTRHLNKRKALEDRSAMVPELPQSFRDWAENELLGISYIYYKRKGRYATFFCSHCGQEYTYPTQAKDSFEGSFEHVVNVPTHNSRGRCEKCDTKAIFKAEGKTNGVYCQSTKAFIGQSIGNEAAVIRYYQIDKYFFKDVKESCRFIEVARTYYMPGKDVQTDYQKYDCYLGKEYWDYKNIGGNSNIRIESGHIYPGTWEELSKTCLKYSGASAYMENYDTENLTKYMTAYHNYPSIEVMSKIGMYKLVNTLINDPWDVDIVKYAKDPCSMLKIEKWQMNILREEHGSPSLLKTLQLEKRLKQHWTKEQRDIVEMLKPEKSKFETAIKHINIQKYINAVEKYAETSFEDCGQGTLGKLKSTSQKYLDYLDMRARRGYEMSNTVYLFPRNLDEAHMKMVLEFEQNKLDERIAFVENEYPDIKKHYRRNYKKYHFEDDEYIIRPARSAEEIVKEGRILHHCVGGDGYLEKHNTDESFILMLRFKKSADVPYITVEIRNDKIIQWYGAHDKKPDEKNIQKWLDDYIKMLSCGVKSEVSVKKSA